MERLEYFLSQADLNGDGKIEEDEVSKFLEEHAATGQLFAPDDARGPEELAKMIHRMADTDHNGKVSTEELRTVLLKQIKVRKGQLHGGGL